MTSRQAFRNIKSSIVLQIATAVSGLILPHFFIQFYGSAINGMVSSITQFLSYLALVEAGISAAAIVELYKPLEENNEERRNYVLSAAKSFYLKSGVLYIVLLGILIGTYPSLIENQTDRITTVLMIIVLASSNLIDYFILGKYRVLLSADQRIYVLNNFQSVGTALNVVVSIALMILHQNVILVKLVATIIYSIRTFFVIAYVHRHYKNVEFNLKTDKNALPQRWNALFHQIVGVICNNTDIILITVCLGKKSLIEASVYYVFNLATSMFTSLATSLSNAITPTFGKLMVSDDNQDFYRMYDIFEFLYFTLIFTVYTCMYLLLLPFVALYTSNATDANYIRPSLVVLFSLMGLVQNIRIPSLSVICAAGHYKQTQWRALCEAVINLTVSIILINKLGIAGAVIGTICSYTYRAIDSVIYNRRFFEYKVQNKSFLRICRNAVLFSGVSILFMKVIPEIESWVGFVGIGSVLFIIVALLFALLNYGFEREKIKEHYSLAKRLLKNREG